MITEQFTGRAQAYVKARPGYPDEAIEYIYNLSPQGAVFADIGAGTGKFTELLARYGNEIFAVEPNADMREQLVITLAPFPNTKIFDGTGEATNLPDKSVDVIISAQALSKFDGEVFRIECLRIGKTDPIVISLWNGEQGDERLGNYEKPLKALYKNPTVRYFPNTVYFTRDKWLLYHASMAGVPMTESDAHYKEYTAKLNATFDRESVDGILRHDLITKVYSERLEK